MSDIDTKAPGQGGEAPDNKQETPTPSPSPAATVVTPPAESKDEMVTVKKSDFEAMKGRQSVLDIRENRLKKRESKLGSGQSLSFKQPVAPKSVSRASDDDDEAASQEDRKAERGLINLALKVEYREVLDANPVLRDMLTKNPLSALPIYAADAVDADDAVELMEEKLSEMKNQLRPPVAPAETKPVEKKPEETPPVGGENYNMMGRPVATEGMQDKEYTDNLKRGDTRSIAAGLSHRLKRSFKR